MDVSSVHALATGANVRITWSIALIGGSLATIFSTSYVKPFNKWLKLIYLIFLPAWLYLADAIRTGDIISRLDIGAILNPNRIPMIFGEINKEYNDQLVSFNIALVLLGIWLIVFLLSWVFNDFFSKNKLYEK
ncbi:hypothetical protein HDF19_13335 [Mucilaginibacter sp. E4BP6]|uniref:hypothetical protein n=1 Tax=Mucilaginibacter sp. E4BP6 TaxID=2723089 RepID=UPI0015C88548|nr:hypothetical protein [Mucilaginibacter sp. E4BP6]NYE66037.1 hypothetical protein [Mucilaginibacter sp. E4BP6]